MIEGIILLLALVLYILAQEIEQRQHDKSVRIAEENLRLRYRSLRDND